MAGIIVLILAIIVIVVIFRRRNSALRPVPQSSMEMAALDTNEIPRSNISLKEPKGVFAGCITYAASLQVRLLIFYGVSQ